jgi:cytochrome c oxidase subunit 2
MRRSRRAATAVCALAALLLAGCSGDVLGVLPESASPEADDVDHLIYLIIWVTGFTLVGVQMVLVWFLFRHRQRDGVKAKYTHGNHAVEMVWTVVPALVLVLLAVYQADLWVRVKSAVPEDNRNPVVVQIFAKQFEWNFRYPGPDGEFDTKDDLVTTGNMVIPIDRPVNAEMRSMDVIHSFFLPNFRFKQDAVPGLKTPIWFRSNKLSADRAPVKDRDGNEQQLDYWDIVCAELCGNAHTSMAGRLFVVSNDDYEAWLAGEETTVKLPAHGKIGPKQSTPGKIWDRWHWQDDPTIKGKPRWQRGVWEPDDLGPDAVSDDEGEDDF